MRDRSWLRPPQRRRSGAQRSVPARYSDLADCTLRIQHVVAIEFDLEKVERIPTVRRLEDDAGPINQVTDWDQEAINVDGMPSREAKICVRRVLTQSATPYENRQIRLSNPFVRHAIHGVTDHCLDRRETSRTHRDLVAGCQSFDRPIAVARRGSACPAQSNGRRDHLEARRQGHAGEGEGDRGGPPPGPGGGGGPGGPADAGLCRAPVAKTAPKTKLPAFSALRRARFIGVLLIRPLHHESGSFTG